MRGGAAALNAQRRTGESQRHAAASPAAISGDASSPHTHQHTFLSETCHGLRLTPWRLRPWCRDQTTQRLCSSMCSDAHVGSGDYGVLNFCPDLTERRIRLFAEARPMTAFMKNKRDQAAKSRDRLPEIRDLNTPRSIQSLLSVIDWSFPAYWCSCCLSLC